MKGPFQWAKRNMTSRVGRSLLSKMSFLFVEALGCVVAGPVSSVEAALGLLRTNSPDAALLDVNLQGVTVLPVAQQCQRRNIPFILVTGYGRLPLDEPLLNDAVRVRKPFNKADIAGVLSTVVG